METQLPLSPKVATPLAHRKRRHSAVIDLTGSDDENHPPPPKCADKKVMSTNGHVITGHIVSTADTAVVNGDGHVVGGEVEADGDEVEDSDGGDDESLFEDMLDTVELEPYRPDDPEDEGGLNPRIVSSLHSRLREIGPAEFITEALTVSQIPPVILGTIFGIDPLVVQIRGEAFFGRLLQAAINRAYHKRQKLTDYNTIDDAAKLLRERKNIMVITGAGISTSLGIPDFRSKETGFYSRLLEMGIEEPEQVFDIYEFDSDPRTFYTLAADILPDLKRYSPTHAFIRLLQDKGKLQTNYTQNIDNVEELAGIDRERLIQCHGSFAMATCRKCKHKVKGSEIFADIRAKRVSRCERCAEAIAAAKEAAPAVKKRKAVSSHARFPSDDDDEDEDDDIPEPGVMKPDITFFGEQLPSNFFERFTEHDARSVDLVIVIGTSLKVAPVSEMPNHLPEHVPHIFISREPVEHVNFDVQLLGGCDDVVVELCRRAGWVLRHEMVPEAFEVVVGGEGCRWRVVRKDGCSVGDKGEEGIEGSA